MLYASRIIIIYNLQTTDVRFLHFFSGISSLTFTKAGEALYLHSSSELQRISLSVAKVTKAHCALNLPPHARSYAESANEIVQDQGVVEGAPETEGETQGSQPTMTNRVIAENGVVGSSEYKPYGNIVSSL